MVLGVQGYTWAWCSLTEFWVIPRCSDCGLGDGWNGCTLLLTAPWWIILRQWDQVKVHNWPGKTHSFFPSKKIRIPKRTCYFQSRWFKPWPFDPHTMEVTNNLWRGHVFTIPKRARKRRIARNPLIFWAAAKPRRNHLEWWFRIREIPPKKVPETFRWLHPWRSTWNIIMDVWKIMFLSKWVICRFHVNLPGCKNYSKKIAQNFHA